MKKKGRYLSLTIFDTIFIDNMLNLISRKKQIFMPTISLAITRLFSLQDDSEWQTIDFR